MTQPTPDCHQQLEDLKKEYEEFTYIVSHDIKAPLRAICNLSSWIKEDLGEGLDPEIQNNIRLLQNRAERLEKMINGLLDFSRVNRYDLEAREVNVETLVADLAAPLQESHQLVVYRSSLPVFSTYSKKLQTVFYHLLQNALKFNDNTPPEVWIEATEQDELYHFKVIDNGIGISPDAQEKIFRMFYSVQPKDTEENLGVGLPLIKKIIQFAGGGIAIQSVPGQGTEVSFTWPKHV